MMAEKLETVSNSDLKSDFSNYMRLQILVHKSNDILRHFFITQWDATRVEAKWEDSDLNRQDFINGPGKELYGKSLRIQKECLRSRNITEWDMPLLIQCIKALKASFPNKVFEKLKSIRNKLAHLGEPRISNEEYDEYWEQISILLLQLDLPQEEIDKVKFTPIETNKQSSQLPELDPKVKELKDSGNEAFNKERFIESIEYYTEAICTPGVSNKDLAILYSNRSIAFLKLEDTSSAKEDAKGSIHLFSTWWKGYYRLAMAYKANEKYEPALKNLLLAQRFHENPKELDDQINLCKRLMWQQRREEHVDPQYFCKTYEEMAQWIPNSTAESLRETDNFCMNFNGARGLCTQGHNFYFGRDVAQDYKEAAKWYGKAAAQGSADGLYNLGRMYMDGKGVMCNFSEGIRLLEQAASQANLVKDELSGRFTIPNVGVSEAQHSLGLVYDEGTGVPKNYEKARHWYTRAIKNWSGASANNMAIMYSNGKGVTRSFDLAVKYWKLGSAMDNIRCMENLADHYYQLRDFENMQHWYLYAVDKGSVALKLGSALSFQEHFKETITQNFKKEEFVQALWREIKNGELKHLIDSEVKAVHDKLKKIMNKAYTIPAKPAHKIDSSTAEAYRKSITIAHRTTFK